MPRSARLDAPGVLHHVIIRGMERRNIFRRDSDREDFLRRVEEILQATRTTCYAWALLPNHAHFLLRTGPVPLATVMRRLLTGYVVSFNRRYNRHGYLFQNRYKSIACQEETYLKELVRYIHLNPVRAGTVTSLTNLGTYPYCGHSALMGKRERRWQELDYVLGYFGSSVGRARRAYLSYLKAGLSQGHREDLVGGGLIRSLGGWTEVKSIRSGGKYHLKSDERVLGDSDFVDEVLSIANEHYSQQAELRRHGYNLQWVARRVSEVCGIDERAIFGRGREQEQVRARDLFCFWAVRELGISVTEVARTIRMTPSGVGYAVRRGEILGEERGYRLGAASI
ncbi:MAG: transposase [Deltaproteobacteria bacterium]